MQAISAWEKRRQGKKPTATGWLPAGAPVHGTGHGKNLAEYMLQIVGPQ